MTGPEAPDHRPEWLRRRRRPYLLTGAALAASAVLVAIAWTVERDRAPAKVRPGVRQRTVAEIVTPAPLSDQELSGSGPRFGSQESVRLQGGAWVQVADSAGNLKQQYTASRIDPLPDKRLSMADPRAVLYGDGGRVVTMRSDSMTARVPRRELESGRLTGNVVIRIFRPAEGRQVDLRADQPDVIVESPEATFDSESGEIRCDRAVRISGPVLAFEGQGLALALSSDGKSLERLVVERATAPVRISRSAVEAQAARDRKGTPPPAAAKRPDVKAGTRPARPAERQRLFQLTLLNDVRVESVESGRRLKVRGERLDAMFFLRGGGGIGISRAAPSAVDACPRVASPPGPPAAMLAALAMAWPAVPAAADEDFITVSFSGRLVLAPAAADTVPPGAPDGVRMRVEGAPAEIDDSQSGAKIRAKVVTFESRVERIRLDGTADSPATVDAPSFALRAEHFELDRAAGRGRSDGAGSVTLGGRDRKAVTVDWNGGMDLTLEPGTGKAEGTFRGADFVGGVTVRSPDFGLASERLSVEAAPAGDRDVPRRILAQGNVRAESFGGSPGRFTAETVDIALSPDGDGRAQPRTLVAAGGVMAGDGTQTLWCSGLRASFRDAAGEPAPGDGLVRSEIGEFTADGPVELLLGDGGRVFGSRLEGDGAARAARLLGPDVMVVRGNLVLDQLSEIAVREGPARANAVGPGRASGFRDPVIAASAGPVGRPRIAALPQMQATWRDSMAYEDGAVPARGGAPAKGLLLLQGSVKVRASREPREAEALDADEVQVEIEPRGEPSADGTGSQFVGTMRALGSVRLEARQWPGPDRRGEPRLFRMNAPSVAYDGRDGSAFVDGAGTLLVFDPPEPLPPERADDPSSPFSPKGTTRFSWKRSLSLERRPDGSGRVIIERETAMDHLGPSAESTGTVTADRMIAVVRAAPGVPSGPAPGTGRGDVSMSLGGPAELTQVSADGRVIIRTAELDIEAGEFELDVPSQVGAARADPGGLVTVLRRGQAAPLRGHAFRWDLVKGSLAVEGARGSLGR